MTHVDVVWDMNMKLQTGRESSKRQMEKDM